MELASKTDLRFRRLGAGRAQVRFPSLRAPSPNAAPFLLPPLTPHRFPPQLEAYQRSKAGDAPPAAPGGPLSDLGQGARPPTSLKKAVPPARGVTPRAPPRAAAAAAAPAAPAGLGAELAASIARAAAPIAAPAPGSTPLGVPSSPLDRRASVRGAPPPPPPPSPHARWAARCAPPRAS
jgi:hypothetical protein